MQETHNGEFFFSGEYCGISWQIWLIADFVEIVRVNLRDRLCFEFFDT